MKPCKVCGEEFEPIRRKRGNLQSICLPCKAVVDPQGFLNYRYKLDREFRHAADEARRRLEKIAALSSA